MIVGKSFIRFTAGNIQKQSIVGLPRIEKLINSINIEHFLPVRSGRWRQRDGEGLRDVAAVRGAARGVKSKDWRRWTDLQSGTILGVSGKISRQLSTYFFISHHGRILFRDLYSNRTFQSRVVGISWHFINLGPIL